MADVGVLNLQIKSNATSAATSLENLAGALTRVKSAVGKGLGLGTVGIQVKTLAKTVNETQSANATIKNLSALFNAISNFSKLKKVKIDVKPFEDIKKALGSGISLGKAGEQMKLMREAMEGDWDASGAVSNMARVASVASVFKAEGTARTLTNMADAMEDYAKAVKALNKVGVMEVHGGGMSDLTTKSGRMKLNLQQFGGKRRGNIEQIPGQMRMALDDFEDTASTIERNSESIIESVNHAESGTNEAFETIKSEFQQINDSAENFTGVTNATANMHEFGEATQIAAGRLGLLQTKYGILSEQFNEGMMEGKFSNLGAVNRLLQLDTLQKQIDRLQTEKDTIRQYGSEMVENIMGHYSQIDLLMMKLDGMRHKLIDDIDSNKVDTQQIADRIMKIQSLQEKIDGLIQKELDAARSSKPFIDSLDDVGKSAMRARDKIAQIYETLEQSSYVNRESIDMMFGIGKTPLSAEDSAQAFMNERTVEIANLIDTLNRPIKMNWAEVTNQITGVNNVAKNAEESFSALLQLTQEDTPLAATIRDLQPEFAEVAENASTAKEALQYVKQAEKEAEKETDKLRFSLSRLGAGFSSLKKSIKDAVPLLSNINHQFGRILLRRAITAVIRSVTKAFSEGVENVYEYSKAIGSGFAPALDSAKSMISQFKNSIGAAVAPALQALIPVFNQVVNAAINVINVINQMFSLLSGKSSWTRALPQATEAFEDTKKAASGAGGAVKDMLAAWDELNVIDKNSGGGGGGAAAAALGEYENMFEEVGEFDSKVREFIEWIEDHLEFIHGLAAGILAALLGLPASISIGIGLLVTGTEMSYNAGYDMGKNGITKDNILQAVKGILAGALGGALIGWKVAGVPGAIIGAVIGVGITVKALADGYEQGRLDSLYGDLEATRDEIADAVREAYLFEITPEIEILESKITGLDELKSSIVTDLSDLNVARIIASNSKFETKDVEDLARKVKQLVSHTQDYIRGMKEYNVYIDTLLNPEIKIASDASGSDGWDALNGVVTDLGTKIGDILSDGVVDEFEAKTLNRLLDSLNSISSAITNAENAEKYSSKAFEIRDAFRTGGLNRESFEIYIDEMEKLNEGTFKEAQKAIDQKVENISALKAGLEAALAAGEETTVINGIKVNIADKLAEVNEQYDYYHNAATGEANRKAEIQALYDRWVKPETIELERTDFLEGFQSVLGNEKDFERVAGKFADAMIKNQTFDIYSGMSHFTKESLDNVILDTVSSLTGQDKQYLIKAQDLFGITGWDMLTKQMKNDFLEAMKRHNVDFKSSISMLKEYYNLDVTDIVGFINWEDLTTDTKDEYILAISEIFGSDKVNSMLKELGEAAGFDYGEAMNDALRRKSIKEFKSYLKEFGGIAEEYGYELTEIIDANWDVIAPMIDTYGLEESMNAVIEIIQMGGEDAGKLLKNFDWVAPIISDKNAKHSLDDIKLLLRYFDKDAQKVIDKWDIIAPYIDTENIEDSLTDLSQFIYQSGADINTILDNWHLLAPEVSGFNIVQSLNYIKTIASQSGVDINTIIANWGIISPMIDPTDTKTSLDHITELIQKYPKTWQEELAKELATKKIKVDATCDVTVNAHINITTNIGKGILTGASAVIKNLQNIPKEADGAYGIPNGDLFIANEAGPELVGTIGGKTSVANQGQIVAGISAGVAEANEEQNSLLREQNNLLRQLLAKDSTVRIGASAALGRVTKQSLDMYGTMAGG